jgi:ABC-type multidrug transport system fused ATPase/permease subunit
MIQNPVFKTRKKKLYTIYILLFIYTFGQTGSAFILTRSIDMLINKNIPDFIYFMIISVVCWIVALIASYSSSIKQQQFIQEVSYELRLLTAKQVKMLEVKFAKDFNASLYTNMVISDIPLIEKGISDYFLIISAILSILFASLALIYFNILIFVIAILFGLLLIVIPQFFKNKIQQATLNVSIENQNIQKNVSNWFAGVPSLISFDALDLLDNIIKKNSEKITEKKIIQTKVNAKISFLIFFINIISQFSLIGITGVLSFYDIVSFGVIISVGNLSSQLFSSLGEFSGLYSSTISTRILLDKFSVQEGYNNETKKIELRDELKIEGLSYSFKDKKINYPTVSFVKGEKYIIKGNSGSGKTTLLNLLNGYLEEYSGNISWDGIPYKEINSNTLRNSITNVSQKVYIFNCSIKDNIILNSKFEKEKFEKAIGKSALKELINSLSDKEETLLDLEKISLSGGELQRISIARAIYHRTSVLFLDEATSSLDRKTADMIEFDLLNDPSLTVLMITHNVSEKIFSMPINIVGID